MAALLDAVQSPGALDRSIQTPGGFMPVDEFARKAITDEMRDGDAFAVQQPVADDATPIERLVAFSGRSI